MSVKTLSCLCALLLSGFCVMFVASTPVARADNVYGTIRGTVTDPSGGVVAGAKITITNEQTGISDSRSSLKDGTYEFDQLLAPAVYAIHVEAAGFEKLEVRDIHVQLDQIFVANLQLKMGGVAQTVQVTEATPNQIDTTSMQLGIAINDTTIVNMPLINRDYSQLMLLQPGVVSNSDARGGGAEGDYSTNGSEAEQNSYLINGADDNDLPLNEVSVQPSVDAISEFTMVTGSINPEYARNSGAILNGVIKSGTNSFHGDGFDFFRDTGFNTRDYFQLTPDVDHQNQFGGTIGGPIWKNHTFFFVSYQGERVSAQELAGDCLCNSPGDTNVFTAAQRGGNFSTSNFNGTPAMLSGGVQTLTVNPNTSPIPLFGDADSGCPVGGSPCPAGTFYGNNYTTPTTGNATLVSHGLFSTGMIPTVDFNNVSNKLLSFVPMPSPGLGDKFEFNPIDTITEDQMLGRIDHTISSQDSIWFYGLWERQPSTQTLPFVGATVPGFEESDLRHFWQFSGAWNHTFGSSMINEVRGGYTRANLQGVNPATPVAPSTAGFSINPQIPAGEGIPVVDVLGLFDLGFSQDGPQPRKDQTYQFTDNFTKIAGKHSLKFGFEMRRFEVLNPFGHEDSGSFSFAGAGPFTTGVPGADFLLGFPDSYIQGSGDVANVRAREYYSYAQDQWKIRNNLTLTIGTGWQIDTPIYDIAHDNHADIAFRPGQQSVVVPTAPVGYVFQGDPGVNADGTTKYDHFGPRIGFAYSPGWGGWLTGGPGKTSIRAGYGIYYNRYNEETATQTQGAPPFAITSSGISSVVPTGFASFAAPFTDIRCITQTGTAIAPGSGACPAVGGSVANSFPYAPGASPNFAALGLLPMGVSVYAPNITIPYAENYTFTIERQLGPNTILSAGYVGSEGRHLLLTLELNPGIEPAVCATEPMCVADRDFQPLFFPSHYKFPGNIFGSVGQVTTEGTSNYNAFEVSVNQHLTHGLQFLAAYTWSHALDEASGFENSGFGGAGAGGFGNLRVTNPFDPKSDYASSNYDARNRFVVSYVYEFPGMHSNSLLSRVTNGWQISGITTLQSGFPLDVVDTALPSLTDSFFNFYCTPGQGCYDVPNQVGSIHYLNPRTSAANPTNQWFSVSPNPFAAPAFGTQGDARRDLLRGPGINLFNFALMKETAITESTRVELRLEAYNVFNHTNFDPNAIVTDFNSSSFGEEFNAINPRILQIAAKFYF